MKRVVSIVAAGLVGAAVLVPSGADAATQVPLPLSSFSDILVDDAHQHVFLTGGAGTNGVVVRDGDGAAVTTITNLPGASGLALSSDGALLYVALEDPAASAIAVISTSSLSEVSRIPTGASTCPTTLAMLGQNLWFGYGCGSGQWNGGLGVVGREVTGEPHVTTGLATGFYNAPAIASSANLPNRIIVSGDYTLSPSAVQAYDVVGASTATPGVTAGPGTQVGSNMQDMALTSDGSHLVTASGSPYYHPGWRTSDLVQDRTYQSNTYPNAVATGSTGLVAAGVNGIYWDDIYISRTDGTFLNSVELGASLVPAGLAFSQSGTTLYAVAKNASGALVIEVLYNLDKAVSVLTASGPQSVTLGQQVTVSGTLTSGGKGLGGAALTVTRQAGTTNGTQLPSVTTAPDGTFTFTDTPTSTGTNSYAIRYAGDATHQSASASVQVQVNAPPSAATTMALSAPASGVVGQQLQLTANLSAGSGPLSARTVTFFQALPGAQATAIGTAQTDAAGNASLVVTPNSPGSIEYTARFAGDSSYAASAASRTVTVQDTTTTTLTAPATVKRATALTLGGTLRNSSGGPVAGVAVRITRQDAAGTAVLGTATTTPNGSFSLQDTPRTTGTATYTATFDGTSQYVGSSGSVAVKVSNSGK